MYVVATVGKKTASYRPGAEPRLQLETRAWGPALTSTFRARGPRPASPSPRGNPGVARVRDHTVRSTPLLSPVNTGSSSEPRREGSQSRRPGAAGADAPAPDPPGPSGRQDTRDTGHRRCDTHGSPRSRRAGRRLRSSARRRRATWSRRRLLRNEHDGHGGDRQGRPGRDAVERRAAGGGRGGRHRWAWARGRPSATTSSKRSFTS